MDFLYGFSVVKSSRAGGGTDDRGPRSGPAGIPIPWAGGAGPVGPGGGEAGPASGVRLQILGPLRLWRDGVELDTGPRQQAYLLALLLAREGRRVSPTELVELIWDGGDPASAVTVIHKYVGALRRLLEP